MGNKWKFLSFRTTLCGAMLIAAGWGMWILELGKGIASHTLEIPILLHGIGVLFATFFYIFQIVIPYRRVEENIKVFLLGYTSSGLKNSEIHLSPASEKLFEMLIKLTESEELLNANKKQAQYLALQNQINPHFLYNTLENIRSEALFQGNESVANMTEALSTFFRYTMSNLENMVTLKEELDNVQIYFSIQKHRFEERIHLSVSYEEEDAWCLKCRIPKLTLQPIVENSIIHGLEQKIGEGTIRIIIRCTEKRLLIQISDDGIGMKPEVLERLNKQLNEPVFESIQLSSNKGGIAIVNVNNRIHLLFGEEYGMTVYSTYKMGTDTVINLPLERG